MKPVEIEERGPLLEQLTELWERPVRATHSFLSEREIGAIRHYAPEALAGVSQLIVAEDARGLPAAFMGIEEGLSLIHIYISGATVSIRSKSRS